MKQSRKIKKLDSLKNSTVVYSIVFKRFNKIVFITGFILVLLAFIDIPLSYNPESGTLFNLIGKPFDFEDLDAYKKHNKSDRFTFEMMKKYLAELGLYPFREDFYLPNSAKLIVREGWPKESHLLYFSTLEEVRSYLRIE